MLRTRALVHLMQRCPFMKPFERLLRHSLLSIPFALGLLACSPADTGAADEDDIDVDEAAQTSASSDLSASYVGRFAPPPGASGGMVAELLLQTDRRYELRAAAGVESGRYRVRTTSTGPKLTLSPSTGGTRTFHVVLGTGFRPRLTLRRGRTTQELERDPVACDGVTCTSGHACAVEARRGVPAPVCSAVVPAPAAWKSALAGHGVWGATLYDVLEPFSGVRKNLYCTVLPEPSQIFCNAMWLGEHATSEVSTGIAPDGTFDFAGSGASAPGKKLRGRIAPDGTVEVDEFAVETCYQTSSFWCEGQKTDRAGRGTPVAICRTRDEVFQSGGTASGYWVACSECRGRCDGL